MMYDYTEGFGHVRLHLQVLYQNGKIILMSMPVHLRKAGFTKPEIDRLPLPPRAKTASLISRQDLVSA